MPRNSSGVYSLPASSVNPPVFATVISPPDFANEEQDIAAEITNSLDRLGRGGMMAPLQMGGNKITGLGPATAATDGVSLADVNGYMPPGAVLDFAMSTPPPGWLECDGSAVSRVGLAALFTAIGTTWGAGDGSTTFNLPDFRAAWRRGWDHGKGVDPARAFASFQDSAILSHTHVQNAHNHAITDPGHTHLVQSQGGTGATAGGVPVSTSPAAQSGSATSGITISNTTAVNQSTGGTESRVKNYAVLTCIRT